MFFWQFYLAVIGFVILVGLWYKNKLDKKIKLCLNNLEEIFNFARFCELGYIKENNSTKRLQLNGKLNDDLVGEIIGNIM